MVILDETSKLSASAKLARSAKQSYESFANRGCKVVTGGRPQKPWHFLLARRRLLEEVSIACNKNTVPGDLSALNPTGIRL
jgi:glycine/serine hydroxymethyltransferase